jgi:hypothetical protein
LSQIEPTAAMGNVGSDKYREHADYRPADAIKQLKADKKQGIRGQGKQQRTDRQSPEPNKEQRPATPTSRLMRCLRIGEGLNASTRRADTIAFSPVFGLSPILSRLMRTLNEPKDDNFTASPRSRQSLISLSTDSNSFTVSVCDSTLLLYIALHKSARVTVAIASPLMR